MIERDADGGVREDGKGRAAGEDLAEVEHELAGGSPDALTQGQHVGHADGLEPPGREVAKAVVSRDGGSPASRVEAGGAPVAELDRVVLALADVEVGVADLAR